MDPTLSILLSILYTILGFVALYMSFRRNHGFHLGSFLMAVFFAPLYIVYALAVPVEGVKLSTT